MNKPLDRSCHPSLAGPPGAPPQRIGIALGGGAARGWAHIGVFRELLAQGIAPSIVAGTSSGAIAGAAYAAGKLDSLEAFTRSLNLRRVLTMMDFSLAGTGLVRGDRLRKQLQRDLGGFSIESLPLPFSAVAAEISTGHEIWLDRGDLVESLRASYALPGIFEPVHLDGRWLFDGAVVNPIPVSVCRAMGADFVIAVNVGTDLGKKTAQGAAFDPVALGIASPGGAKTLSPADATKPDLARPGLLAKRAPKIASVMMEAFNISQDRIARARLAESPPDIMINAKLSSVGIFDFHRAAELIAYGRLAVQMAMPEIETHLSGAMSGQI